ncbi:hypothetical protein DXG01_007177 [Tephrocybe rancida]|nr:hypothetical protein DXG01_007177 [Tephrocybe rancida]
MAQNSGPVNVENALLRSRSFRRQPGHNPYPVQHVGSSSSVFDVWNNLFRTRGHSLTLHEFETPPAVVLDLGCGSGHWVIEAAKIWKDSTFVGYDFRNMQPNLHHPKTLKYHRGIAHRIEWFHGNLLDGLPFSSDQFDLVRVVNIGLGVPEDEVIEEDPIFPCVGPMIQRTKYGDSSQTLINGPSIVVPPKKPTIVVPPKKPSIDIPTDRYFASASSATIWSDHVEIKLNSLQRYGISSPTSTTTALSSPTTPVSAQPFSPTIPASIHPYSPTTPFTPKTPTSSHPYSPTTPVSAHPIAASTTSHSSSVSDYTQSHQHLPYIPRNSVSHAETDRVPDLRNHLRLKAAWNSMLASRFIAENLVSVLPFYLSSLFIDVQSQPPTKVLLPPNSKAGPDLQRSSSESFENSILPSDSSFTSLPSPPRTSNASTWSSKSAASTTALSRSPSGTSLESYTSDYARMHLANTVHVVSGCKEAIWQEYKKLFDVHVAKVVSPQADAPSGYAAYSGPGNVKSSIRESFDDEWTSWYNDMSDRIGMRGLMAQYHWTEPPGHRPDWHVWRAKVQATDDIYARSSTDTPDICRSMRSFVAWKPLPEP